MKIHNAKNFRYEEFFSQSYFEKWKNTPYWLINSIDPMVPILAQFIRDRYKKSVTINNWLWRKENNYPYDNSGFRDGLCNEGSLVSRHRLGKCIDVKIGDKIDETASELQQDIRDNFEEFSDYGLTAMEQDTHTWTHLSVENVDWRTQSGLWVIPNPDKKGE